MVGTKDAKLHKHWLIRYYGVYFAEQNRTEQNSYFSLSEKKYTGRGLSAYGLRKNFLAPSQTKATTFKSAASRDGIIDQLRGCVYV